MEKFDGGNFHFWKFKMRMMLSKYGLWKFVDGSATLPSEEVARANYNEKETNAFALLCEHLSNGQLSSLRVFVVALVFKMSFFQMESLHFVINCFKKKNDEKEKVNQACEDQEQMFVTALSANDHTTYDWIFDSDATQQMTFQ
jgi:hypothetical protein